MTCKYAGLTINERLFASGLMPAFDEAISRKDWAKVKEVLETLELGREDVKAVLKLLAE